MSAMKQKTAARLAAIQVLYGRDITENTAEPANQVLDIIASHQGREFGEEEYAHPDERFLLQLVTGTTAMIPQLDARISSHLNQGWDMEKIGAVMRALLRTAIYELIACNDIPVKVVVNEYVSIARAFFNESETGFVNGIVDKIAKQVRPALPIETEK